MERWVQGRTQRKMGEAERKASKIDTEREGARSGER